MKEDDTDDINLKKIEQIHVKVIVASYINEVEKNINKWLNEETEDIHIISISQIDSPGKIFTSVFYRYV